MGYQLDNCDFSCVTLTLKCVTLTPLTVCNVILTQKCVTFVTFVTLCVAAAVLDEIIPSRKRWDYLSFLLSSGRGIFRRWLLSSILMGRVVRLLERAEEGCEGLKHGCYDLPCVCFLSSLCHSGDIRLVRCLASPPSR